MEAILEFCVAQGLLGPEEAERFAFEHERRWNSLVRLLVEQAVDSRKLYAAYAVSKGLACVPCGDDKKALVDTVAQARENWPGSLENLDYFNALPWSATEVLEVVTWKLGAESVIAAALGNLLGRPVNVLLMEPRCFGHVKTELN